MEQTMKKYTNQYTNYENTNYEKIKVNSSFGISKTLYDNDSYYYNYLERECYKVLKFHVKNSS